MELSTLLRQKLHACGATSQSLEKLAHYVAAIRQWNKAINLVAPSTLGAIWERHILDSAQLFPLIQSGPSASRVIDLGSGGGLPGLVLAMLGVDDMTLVESDKRKCVFLREVSRETGLENVNIINERIENIKLQAPFITARALAPLSQLVAWAEPLLDQGRGQMLFLKGRDAGNEIATLPTALQSAIQMAPSLTDENSTIVKITY